MIDRRTVLTGAGVGLGMMVARHAGADDKKRKAPDVRETLLDALAACMARAYACDSHCATQLASGAKEFAHCATAVADLLAIGEGVRRLVSRRSPGAKKVVDAFATLCKECSIACLEHKEHWAHGMHLECKECREACDACVTACAAFVVV